LPVIALNISDGLGERDAVNFVSRSK